jgi:hypothetical protein
VGSVHVWRWARSFDGPIVPDFQVQLDHRDSNMVEGPRALTVMFAISSPRAILFLSFAFAPAAVHAEFTPISQSTHFDEPSLIGQISSILETVYGESNLERLDDAQDILFAHTGDTISLRGIALYTLGAKTVGVIPDGASEFVPVARFQNFGYFPQAVDHLYHTPILNPSISRADSGQFFRLAMPFSRVNTPNPLTSDPTLNSPLGPRDLLVTFRIVNSIGHPMNVIGNYVVAWEDNDSAFSDQDYQDMVMELGGVALVPEPTPMLLLAPVLALAICFGGRTRHNYS